MDLHDFRTDYLLGGLSREDLRADPIEQFELWMQQAIAADIREPSAMVLATVDSKMQPSQRIVLLKKVSAEGFVFFTDQQSQKGRELAQNRQASLLFPWHSLERQVRVQGVVSDLPRDEVNDYFQSRPRGSQLAAATSEQSNQIESRAKLLSQYRQLEADFSDSNVPLPDRWGGYQLKPKIVEFWQGGEHRLHDRFQYTADTSSVWKLRRLQP